MNTRPTRDDVARLAGVSVTTVTYVINKGPRGVNEDTKARVLSAIEQLGYRPHVIARSLKTGSTRTIGLLVPTLLSPFATELATVAEDCLYARNYEPLLVSSHEDYDREAELLQVLTDRSVDGLLYIPSSTRHVEHVERVLREGIPLVLIDRSIPGVRADVVVSNNREAALIATRRLLHEGCRHTVCLSFSEEASTAQDRVSGYRQAVAEAGLPEDRHHVITVPYEMWGNPEELLVEHVEEHGLPDGIFSTTDIFLAGSYKTLRRLGPEGQRVRMAGGFVSSVSPWVGLLEQPPALVRQDVEGMARRAVECLMRRLEDDERPPSEEVVPCSFVAPEELTA